MILHERTLTVRKAKCDLSLAVLRFVDDHDLTFIELIGLLLEEASNWQGHALRLERHGTTEKKADEK